MPGIGSLQYSLGGGGKLWWSYRVAIISCFGDAFTLSGSDNDTSIRDIEVNALTNVFYSLGRQGQRTANEKLPGKAVQTLESWSKRLGVKTYLENSDSNIRSGCAAKYKAQAGPTEQVIIDTIETALGSSVVEILFPDEALAAQYTYWEGINPGVPEDLGTDAVGEWSSLRSHMLVVVSPSNGLSLKEDQQNIETVLTSILESLLPAYSTWDYQISSTPYDGFYLDDSLLDITAL